MDENNVDNGNNQDQEEKKFTQSELDEIINKRLEREKKKRGSDPEQAQRLAELEAKEKDLSRRELLLSCKSYLHDNDMSADLIDIISADTLEEFKEKADKVAQITRQPKKTAPAASESITNWGNSQQIADAFSVRNKHKPKEY